MKRGIETYDLETDSFVLVEIEDRPDQLMIATRNNLGLDTTKLVKGLGFVIGEYDKTGDLFLTTTPEKLLGKNWVISFPGRDRDPNLFAIYLEHGEKGKPEYVEFIRQIKVDDKYVLFIP